LHAFLPPKKHVAPFQERSEIVAGGMNKSGFFKQSATNRPDKPVDSSLLKQASSTEQYSGIFTYFIKRPGL